MAYLVFSCSLNPESRSLILARRVTELLRAKGAEVELVDIRELNLPACDGDACYDDPNVEKLRAKIEAAHGTLIASPIYNFGVAACDGDTCYDDPAVERLRAKIEAAHGTLIATPIYNFGVAASTKNLIELTGAAWTKKVVGFLCAAGGRSSYMSVMGLANSLMLDFHSVIVPRFVFAGDDSFEGDDIADPAVVERLDDLADTLILFGGALQKYSGPGAE